MYRLIKIIAIIFICSLCVSCSEDTLVESGMGVVTGKVVEAETFIPLENVKISSSPNSSTVYTDAEGNFSIQNIVNGTYSFEARKDNYIVKFEGATVNVNAVTVISFELQPKEEENFPPNVPVLVSPIDGAFDQSLSTILTWTCTDPESDVLTYKVILRNDINSDVIEFEGISETTFELTGLNYSTKYYWQIAASDGINPEVNSVVSSFRTLTFPNARYLFVEKVGDNNVIFTADDSGNKLQLTSNITNSFRPRKNAQANKIAFIRSTGGQAHIYTMSPDGSNVFKVTNSVPIAGFNLDHVNYSWKSNGSQLIYSNFDKLYQINADGSGLMQIFQTPNGKFISECNWSNDSSVIALKVNNLNGYEVEIYTIDILGGVLTNIISGFGGAYGGLHLSVDNNKLIFTRDITEYESNDYRQLDSRIFLYDFTTNITTEIDVQKPAGFNDLDVMFSPNEAEVIFVSTSNDGVSMKSIVKCEIYSSPNREVLFNNATMPDWK
jgi:Tol biopolymer transport system component